MRSLTRRSFGLLAASTLVGSAMATAPHEVNTDRNRFIRDFLDRTYTVGALTCIEYLPDDPERVKDVMYQTFINAMQDFKDNRWISDYFIKCFLEDKEWRLPTDLLVVEITWVGPRGEPGGVYSA